MTYTKVVYDQVLDGLRDILNNTFRNVYIGGFKELSGRESLRIELITSDPIITTGDWKAREYSLTLYLYHGYAESPRNTEQISNRIDKLEEALLDAQCTSEWFQLTVDETRYKTQEEGDELNGHPMNITELDVTIKNSVAF